MSCSSHNSCDKKLDGKLVLEEGYWAGITSNGSLVTYFCPHKYCNCTRAPGYLKGCLFDPDNKNEQCSKNREGWLCGKCSGNTSIGLRYPLLISNLYVITISFRLTDRHFVK